MAEFQAARDKLKNLQNIHNEIVFVAVTSGRLKLFISSADGKLGEFHRESADSRHLKMNEDGCHKFKVRCSQRQKKTADGKTCTVNYKYELFARLLLM